jgi:glycine cleavage system pyridoxal-binding protein P
VNDVVRKKKKFFADQHLHPQTLALLKTRAEYVLSLA